MRSSGTLVLLLLAIPALATEGNTLRLFLAQEGVDGNTPLGTVTPTLSNPVLSSGGMDVHRLYVWAQVLGTDPGPQKYIGIGYNIVTTGSARFVDMHNWNYTNMMQRWQPGFRTGSINADGDLMNVRLGAPPLPGSFGVADTDGMGDLDEQHHDGLRATVIGWVDVQGHGELFFQVGNFKIVRTGMPADDVSVYFGFGDEGDDITGNDVDTGSSIADGVLVPEPGALVLVALALTFARRRQASPAV